MESSSSNETMKFMIEEAQLDKDTNMFLTMNPNYEIVYNKQKITGPKSFDGGKEPTWSDFDSINHTIFLDGTQNVKITFYCDGTEICGTILKISDLKATMGSKQYYDTKRSGTTSGNFTMKAYYSGDPAPAQKPQQAPQFGNDIQKPYNPYAQQQQPAMGMAVGGGGNDVFVAQPVSGIVNAQMMGQQSMMGQPMQGMPGAPSAYPSMSVGQAPQMGVDFVQTANVGAPPMNNMPYQQNANYNAFAAKYANQQATGQVQMMGNMGQPNPMQQTPMHPMGGMPMGGQPMPMGGQPMPMGGMAMPNGGLAMPMGGQPMPMGGMPMPMGGQPMMGQQMQQPMMGGQPQMMQGLPGQFQQQTPYQQYPGQNYNQFGGQQF